MSLHSCSIDRPVSEFQYILQCMFNHVVDVIGHARTSRKQKKEAETIEACGSLLRALLQPLDLREGNMGASLLLAAQANHHERRSRC